MPNQQMDSGRDASNNAFKKGDRHLMVSSLSAPVKYRTRISPGVYRPTSCSTRREMTGNHMPQGARSIAEACLDALATAAVEGTRAAGDHSVHGAGTGGGVPTPTTVVTKHGSARHEPTTVPARVDSTLLLEPLRLAQSSRDSSHGGRCSAQREQPHLRAWEHQIRYRRDRIHTRRPRIRHHSRQP